MVLALENTETFDATHYPLDEAAAAALVDSGTALVAVAIPPRFEEQISALGNPARVQVILDGADPSAARVAEMSARGPWQLLLSGSSWNVLVMLSISGGRSLRSICASGSTRN